MSTGWALLFSAVLLAGNAFFVAAEFALVASKRYRFEQAAANGSKAARAALEGSHELSLMLAGAQLGITLCTLALGALAEPAIAHTIEPALVATGLPHQTSYAIGFAIALIVVVFLHIVIGEMAPKSWAISDPERSALLLARPFRAFAHLVRPALAGLNGISNGILRLARVHPQDQLAQVHGPEELAMLLEQSKEHGTLETAQHDLLSRLLRLRQTTLSRVMEPLGDLVTVSARAPAEEIEQTCAASGRSRVAVADGPGHLVGLVHVRDAIRATTAGRPASASDLMTAPLRLEASLTVVDAVAAMRQHRAQLALVDIEGRTMGFAALEDLLEEVIGEFADETD